MILSAEIRLHDTKKAKYYFYQDIKRFQSGHIFLIVR